MDNSGQSSGGKQMVRVLLGMAAVTLAVTGQFWMRLTPDGLAPGLTLMAIAVALLVLGSIGRFPAALVRLVSRWSITRFGLLVGVAILLSVTAAAAAVAFERLGLMNFTPVSLLLAGSALTYALAWAPGGVSLSQWRSWLLAHRAEMAAVGLVTLVGAGLRFYQLGAVPRVINGDEGMVGLAALRSNSLPLANPFALFENFGGVYMQAIGLALALLGRTPFALRLLPAVGGTLAIPALYLWGRWMFGHRVGLFAALLLALSHAHMHFSRTAAVGYIQGTALMPLELYLFFSGLEKRRPLRAALGGMILGLHFSVYISAQIMAALLLAYLLIAFVLHRSFILAAGRAIAAFWLGTLLIGLPQFVYSWQHPDEFMARLNADGMFQSGWLAQQAAKTGQPVVEILAGRVAHAFLSLIYYPATEFYGINAPVLGVIAATLFVLGVGLALWRTRDNRYLLLNGYFWAMTMAVGVFAVPPEADSYRMLAALPAVMLLAAIGWEQVMTLWSFTDAARAPARLLATGVLLAGVGLLNVQTYFVDFAGQCRYGNDIQTRFASYLGNYLKSVDRESTVYLLSDAALLYGTHSSVDFLSRNLPVQNFPDPIQGLTPATQSIIIAIPAREAELRSWVNQHPGGTLHREYDCGRLMLMAYRSP